jgi:hypothetical protein
LIEIDRTLCLLIELYVCPLIKARCAASFKTVPA